MFSSSSDEIADIYVIEKELQELLESEGVKWQRIMQLLIMVQAGELYKKVTPTFTAWVKLKASDFNIHESNLWRILNAGKFYLSIQQQAGLSDIMHTKVTPEQLELVKKISSVAPLSVCEDLIEKIKTGDLNRDGLRDTWQIYRKVKEGQTDRGRKPSQGVYQSSSGDYFSEDFSIYEQPSSSGNRLLTEANLMQALHQDHTWTLDAGEQRIDAGEQTGQSLEIAEVKVSEIFRNVTLPGEKQLEVMVLKKGNGQKEMLLYGVKLLSEVSFIDKKGGFDEFLPFCHYLYIAIFENKRVIESAMSLYGQHIGILSVNEHLQVYVQRKAQLRQPSCLQQSLSYLLETLTKWHTY